MESFMSKQFNLFGLNFTMKTCLLIGSSLISLYLFKSYTAGGVCKVKKDLTGKMAVITGGNTGIGR
jgi:hypothetical protein